MNTNPDFFRALKVLETFKVNSLPDIATVTSQVAGLIERNNFIGDLSIRILLPRQNWGVSRAQKWGASLRSELILMLKRKKIKSNLREVRYVHDENYFGWILIEPTLLDDLQVWYIAAEILKRLKSKQALYSRGLRGDLNPPQAVPALVQCRF